MYNVDIVVLCVLVALVFGTRKNTSALILMWRLSVRNSTKSVEILGASGNLRLEQDVACRSLTQFETQKSDGFSSEELLKVALAVINSLCFEMGSGDRLFLAFNAARSDIEKLGIEPKKANAIFLKFARAAEFSRQRNPFVQGGFL